MSLTRPEPASLKALVDMVSSGQVYAIALGSPRNVMSKTLLQGFSEPHAAIALIRTFNCGIEPAANWLMEHPDAEQEIEAHAQSQVSIFTAEQCVTGECGS